MRSLHVRTAQVVKKYRTPFGEIVFRHSADLRCLAHSCADRPWCCHYDNAYSIAVVTPAVGIGPRAVGSTTATHHSN